METPLFSPHSYLGILLKNYRLSSVKHRKGIHLRTVEIANFMSKYNTPIIILKVKMLLTYSNLQDKKSEHLFMSFITLLLPYITAIHTALHFWFQSAFPLETCHLPTWSCSEASEKPWPGVSSSLIATTLCPCSGAV